MNHKLIRIEHDLFGALFDLESNFDTALIAPFPAELKIVDRDGVVCWLDTGNWILVSRDCLFVGVLEMSYVSGSTSRSEAMFLNEL
jgi:hypothetical protein